MLSLFHSCRLFLTGVLFLSSVAKANDAASNKNDAATGTAESPIVALREGFLDWKFGMFLHYGMATYNERQWATGTEDPASFQPTALDCNQWIDAAARAGMKYAVLTVKHTGAWCLWDSKHTASHDISAFKNYKNGKGDIVREYVDACRKRGLKVGIYYCFPGDFARRHLPKGEKDMLHGLPPEAQGDYVGFIKKQFAELLGNYGNIDLLWIDQYNNKCTPAEWHELFHYAKALQKNCLVIANNSEDFTKTDIHSYEYPFRVAMKRTVTLPSETNQDPAEVCDKLGAGWYWTTKEKDYSMRSAQEIVDMLRICNARRANYLLNVSPDRSGKIPEDQLQRLREIGDLLKAQNDK